MKRGKGYRNYCRKAAALAGILASFSVVLYPSATNVFAAQKQEVVIPVSQLYSATSYGADTAEGSFSYELTADTAGAPLPEGSDSGSSFVFSMQKETSKDLTVSFTEPGDYHYSLSCISRDGNGYLVDTQVYTVDAYILPAGDGGVRFGAMHIKDAQGDKKANAEFSQSYDGNLTTPESVIAVDPPVKKTVKGTPAKKSDFCFSLQARDASQPMPEGSENGRKLLYITGEGEGEFGDWTYSAPGTYVYDISEVNTGEEGYAFDQTVYTITDTVTRVGTGLEYSRSITANGVSYAEDSVDFVNEYTGVPVTEQTTAPGNYDGGSSSGSTRLGGTDTGDKANIAPFIVIPAAAAGIVISAVFGFKRSRKTVK